MPFSISIHALREEGDSVVLVSLWGTVAFLSTPSARRATADRQHPGPHHHHFYPRPPRGGRHDGAVEVWCSDLFLSTPSARRATSLAFDMVFSLRISIHALREEGDQRSIGNGEAQSIISIHALREEGDAVAPANVLAETYFYPRPPRGGRRVAWTSDIDDYKFLSTPSARRATAKTETKSLFSNKLYNILHEFRRALIYNGSKSYPNHAK